MELWCRGCIRCEAKKAREESALKKSVTGEHFAHDGIDILGPYNVLSSGKRHILVVSDYFSKWEKDCGRDFGGRVYQNDGSASDYPPLSTEYFRV